MEKHQVRRERYLAYDFALRAAENVVSINKGIKSVEDIIKDAEKIYQFLIKPE